MVFCCLSHDVVVHETTHALIDGIRKRFMDPSSPDQAAFHEGLADAIALLSVFAMRNIVETVIERRGKSIPSRKGAQNHRSEGCYTQKAYSSRCSSGSPTKWGRAHQRARGSASQLGETEAIAQPYQRSRVRRAAPPRRDPRRGDDEHISRCVASPIGHAGRSERAVSGSRPSLRGGGRHRGPIADDGDSWARLLPADPSLVLRLFERGAHGGLGDPPRRQRVTVSARRFEQTSKPTGFPHLPTRTRSPACGRKSQKSSAPNECTSRSLQRDPDEVFRFVWENRGAPRVRRAPIRGSNRCAPACGSTPTMASRCARRSWNVCNGSMSRLGIVANAADRETRRHARRPGNPAPGGATLIFDNFGQLKYEIDNRIGDAGEQSARLRDLWNYGFFQDGNDRARRFAALHRRRSTRAFHRASEAW